MLWDQLCQISCTRNTKFIYNEFYIFNFQFFILKNIGEEILKSKWFKRASNLSYCSNSNFSFELYLEGLVSCYRLSACGPWTWRSGGRCESPNEA